AGLREAYVQPAELHVLIVQWRLHGAAPDGSPIPNRHRREPVATEDSIPHLGRDPVVGPDQSCWSVLVPAAQEDVVDAADGDSPAVDRPPVKMRDEVASGP